MLDNLLPTWATGFAESYLDVGAQLCTRDGRRCGNAVVVEVQSHGATVVTDAGTKMVLNRDELEELFYRPKYTMLPEEAPGHRRS